MPKRRLLLGLLAVGAVVAIVSIAFGGDDDKADTGNPHGIPVLDPDPSLHGNFRIGASPAPFAGAAPLEVKFAAKPFEPNGDVKYFWTFDDSYTSTEQNPVHTFKKPGYYLVNVTATDEKQQTFGQALYLGVWPPKVWKLALKGKVDPYAEARKNQRRTAARKKAQDEACERDPDCKRRSEIFKKEDLARRQEQRRKCLADPACRARNKAARKELVRTQKALAERRARERAAARRARREAQRRLERLKREAEKESRAR